MPTIVHGFDWPDRLVVGTVGRPGERAFYLQARDGARLVSVALEKEQSALLAAGIDEMLDEIMTAEGNRWSVPVDIPDELVDDRPLDQPVELEFRTGAMSLGWDPTTAQIIIEAYALDETGDAEGGADGISDEPSEVLQVRIPVGAARAFARRTVGVVEAGRRTCSRCGEPMDPNGHRCPFGELS